MLLTKAGCERRINSQEIRSVERGICPIAKILNNILNMMARNKSLLYIHSQ